MLLLRRLSGLTTDAAYRELLVDTVLLPARRSGRPASPEESGPDTHSWRAMAQDVVELVRHLGHARFAIVGHDRGALVGVRAGLDHPDVISRLGIFDVLPTTDTWDAPETVTAFVRALLARWNTSPRRFAC